MNDFRGNSLAEWYLENPLHPRLVGRARSDDAILGYDEDGQLTVIQLYHRRDPAQRASGPAVGASLVAGRIGSRSGKLRPRSA